MTGLSKIGLVLEGGGTRAIFTSGVLDAFLKHNISFDYVIGVSAGSCNGTSFVGKNYKRQHDITIDYVNDERYMGIKSMLKSGNYLNLPWIFGELTYDINALDQDEFENSKTTMHAVVTNAETGLGEYYVVDDIRKECPLLAASCALPLATKGIEYNGSVYFDGGIVDSIPVDHALSDGCDKAVVILTQHDGYQKKPLRNATVVSKALRKYPLLATALANRSEMYNAQLERVRELESQGKVFVIQPREPLACGTLEKNTLKLEQVYEIGRIYGKAAVEKLEEFMKD